MGAVPLASNLYSPSPSSPTLSLTSWVSPGGTRVLSLELRIFFTAGLHVWVASLKYASCPQPFQLHAAALVFGKEWYFFSTWRLHCGW
jgi:hypothetical protein